jgi:hypothetical protein
MVDGPSLDGKRVADTEVDLYQEARSLLARAVWMEADDTVRAELALPIAHLPLDRRPRDDAEVDYLVGDDERLFVLYPVGDGLRTIVLVDALAAGPTHDSATDRESPPLSTTLELQLEDRRQQAIASLWFSGKREWAVGPKSSAGAREATLWFLSRYGEVDDGATEERGAAPRLDRCSYVQGPPSLVDQLVAKGIAVADFDRGPARGDLVLLVEGKNITTARLERAAIDGFKRVFDNWVKKRRAHRLRVGQLKVVTFGMDSTSLRGALDHEQASRAR